MRDLDEQAGPPRLGTFAALRHRNYRFWFFGQLVSLIGTWMQTTAQGFLVFQLTRSPAYLGYVGFAAGLPSWLLMLLGGVVADRAPRRRLLIATQSALLLQAATLALLTFAGVIRPWHILTMATCLGVVTAFDAPARQAFILEMVDRETLTNAIALNSTVFNSATSVGPAVAGIVYAAAGPGWCFGLNAISFVAVIAALAAMRIPPRATAGRQGTARQQLVEGVRFVAQHRSIRVLILALAMCSMLGMGMMTLMPVWAVEVLGGHARMNGLLYSARGVGSLGGALMIASLGRFHRGRLLTLGTFLLPALMLLFASMRQVVTSFGSLVLIGWSFMIVFNMINTLVQTQTPDALRGRVMSIYSLTFFGLMPIGALLAGSVAASLGAPLAVTINAGTLLVFAASVALLFPDLRRLHGG